MPELQRTITEHYIRCTLKDMGNDPERTLRKLVDMGVSQISTERQKGFLRAVQTMLETQESSYYEVARHAGFHIDLERLIRFGMNLGYVGCVEGAETIQHMETKLHCHIPWEIFLCMDNKIIPEKIERYQKLILTGKRLGIYCWLIQASDDLKQILPLIQENQDCAFFILCPPSAITEERLDELQNLHNQMPCVLWEDGVAYACHALQERKMLFSVYTGYTEDKAEFIKSGVFFEEAQQQHPLFSIAVAQKDCSEETRKEVAYKVIEYRNEQVFRTIPVELRGDCEAVDRLISETQQFISFDEQGNLHVSGTEYPQFNLFHMELSEMLKAVCPIQ